MADALSGWQAVAGTAIVISIIIAGIALGLGRAFSFKRLERFGADELIQSVINAAILGFAVGLSVLVVQIGAEFTPQMANLTCISGGLNYTPPDYALCALNSTSQSSFSLSQNLVRTNNVLGYYQSLDMNFGNFSIQPLSNLGQPANELGNVLYSLQFSTFASALNAQFISFISSSWFGTIFAAGLVLRSFFLSRKFGAFLIAAAISLIIFYPLMLLMFPLPLDSLASADAAASAFLSNPSYATVPIMDLNGNSAIASRIYNMSYSGGQDFTGDLTLLIQHSTNAAASAFFYCVLVPLFALMATLVLIKELSSSFAGEIATEITQV